MSKKKQGVQVLYSSLKYNWMQYITHATIEMNPIYKSGFKLAKQFDSYFMTRKSTQVQLNFFHDVKTVEGICNPTSLKLKWINGYDRRYDLSQECWESIQAEIEYINKNVLIERQFSGIDDEVD